jgi:flagella basal body P-ring formation protein FlgA
MDSLRPAGLDFAGPAGRANLVNPGQVVLHLRGGGHGRARELLVSGEALCRRAVWLPRRDLRAGVTLGEGDVERAEGWYPPSSLSADERPAAGSYTKRGLIRGRPIGRDDLQEPPLVRRGEALRVLYLSPGLTLSGRGVARRDAWREDRVEVRLEGAGKDCLGLVTGAGEVTIREEGGTP